MIWGVALESKIDEKSVLGGLLGPRPILEVQKLPETLVLGGQVGAFLGLSGLLATSWSFKKRLEAFRGGLGHFFLFRSKFLAYLGLHFGSILDPKTVPRSLKNRSKIHAHRKFEKKAYFEASCIENSR
jgi:hypothetical protein